MNNYESTKTKKNYSQYFVIEENFVRYSQRKKHGKRIKNCNQVKTNKKITETTIMQTKLFLLLQKVSLKY